MSSKIVDVNALEILDSRGNPTIRVLEKSGKRDKRTRMQRIDLAARGAVGFTLLQPCTDTVKKSINVLSVIPSRRRNLCAQNCKSS